MKELKHQNNWGGGQFNFTKSEVLNKHIKIYNSDNVYLCDGFITSEVKRHGTDYDHGHVDQWTNVDYIYELPDDPFERNTKLLDLLDEGFLVFLKDS